MSVPPEMQGGVTVDVGLAIATLSWMVDDSVSLNDDSASPASDVLPPHRRAQPCVSSINSKPQIRPVYSSYIVAVAISYDTKPDSLQTPKHNK